MFAAAAAALLVVLALVPPAAAAPSVGEAVAKALEQLELNHLKTAELELLDACYAHDALPADATAAADSAALLAGLQAVTAASVEAGIQEYHGWGDKFPPPPTAVVLLFKLARMHDAAGKHAEAFAAAAAANKAATDHSGGVLRGKSGRTQAKKLLALPCEWDAATFGKVQRFAEADFAPADGSPDAAAGVTPLFVLGAPGSGAAALERALGAHPGVAAKGAKSPGEALAVQLEGLAKEVKAPMHEFLPDLQADSLKGMANYTRFGLAAAAKHGETVVSTSVFADLASAWFLPAVFVDVKVVLVKRSPTDALAAAFFGAFETALPHERKDLDYAFGKKAGPFGHYHGAYERALDHLAAELPKVGIPVLVVAFEDLEASVDAVVDFAGLAPHAAPKAAYAAHAATNGALEGRVGRGLPYVGKSWQDAKGRLAEAGPKADAALKHECGAGAKEL